MLRASFGIIGSNVPSLIRALVACGWFGVQTLFGGIAIHLLLSALFDGWAALGGTGEVLGFFIFWVANLAVVIRGSESIKFLEALAAPLLLIVAIGLLLWALPKISLGEVLATPATRPEGEPVTKYFLSGLTAMVGFWATLSLNIPDFSRYARKQSSQVMGQIIGLPLTMLLFAGLGVVLTAASVELTGETISDPINLIGRIDSDIGVVIAMIMIILATISTNTAANIVSPTNVFQNVAPKIINEDRGVIITGIIGLALMSWELLKKLGWLETDVSVESLYSNWLLGLLEPARANRRHHDRRLLPDQESGVQSTGPVPGQRRLPGLEQIRLYRFPGTGRTDAHRRNNRRCFHGSMTTAGSRARSWAA